MILSALLTVLIVAVAYIGELLPTFILVIALKGLTASAVVLNVWWLTLAFAAVTGLLFFVTAICTAKFNE